MGMPFLMTEEKEYDFHFDMKCKEEQTFSVTLVM